MTMTETDSAVRIKGAMKEGYGDILTPEALSFLAKLERACGEERRALMARRQDIQKRLDAGERPARATSGPAVTGDWKVNPAPADLADRRVEITGPVDRKMIINALNSGAKCFMADCEDASTPSWSNMVEGQINLRDANARQIDYTDPNSGKHYALNDQIATLIVRPRGWHLEEAHVEVDGRPMSGGLFDFGLYLFHNHTRLKAIGSGPYFYFPKLETPEEAALWARALTLAEDELGLPRGTVRCTILIETILATFVLEEILYELRDWITALNCGRWDYIFSYIKRFRNDPTKILPDRAQVTMTVPFMRAYSRLVIDTCHKRGAHAMGGMSAFIPVKNDEAANELAFSRLHADKTREAGDGHDGTWVAHPGMVGAAMDVFDEHMPGPNQVGKRLDVSDFSDEDLIAPCDGTITREGVHGNISVGIQYIASWLRGSGAAPINNLMEDAATAEIARAQLWQWRVHGARLEDGTLIDAALLRVAFEEEIARLKQQFGTDFDAGRFAEAAEIMADIVFDDDFAEFLTLPAYARIKEA